MPRRRLQVVCTSSDEDETEVRQPPQQQDIFHEIIEPDEDDDHDRIISSINFQNVTLHSSTSNPPSRNPSITQPVPFQISDSDSDADDVINVSGVPIGLNSNSVNSEYADGSIGSILQRMGLKLRRGWLESCVRGLENSIPGFSGFDDSRKAKLCFEQFLYADMNFCGAGVLPQNVHSLHLVDLKGPFVLQVDEIVNISCPLRTRFQNVAAGLKRCLKLSMTDGVQRVFGMEYRPIKDIEVLSPAGLKVVVSNVHVRHGLLMLVPEVIEVLGGKVDELDAAQKRLVQEVNKPPRGKRTRAGVVPPLSTRATLAAWPPETVNVNVQEGSVSSRTEMMPPSSNHQAIPVRDNTRQSHSASTHREDAGSYRSSVAETDGIHVFAGMEQHASGIPTVQTSFPVSGQVAEPVAVSNASMEVEDGVSNLSSAAEANEIHMAAGLEHHASGMPVQASFPVSEEGAEPISVSSAEMDVEDIDMFDELEHPFLSTLEKDIPFTYLACLSAKWTAVKDRESKVEGRIKGFLTGVKGFQYQQRTTYDLHVYVDDGSLISEILIDNNVVKKCIGHSPVEVSTALASSDTKRVSVMKHTLKQFQIYLANFEGTMRVQMTEASSVPVAVEMNQGCTVSDAWLLLERFKSSCSGQQRLHYTLV